MPKKSRTTTSKSLLGRGASQDVHGESEKVRPNRVGGASQQKISPNRRRSMVKADQESLRELDSLMASADSVVIVQGKQQTKVSDHSFQTIKHVVHALGSSGKHGTELTSQEAADLLNVSRPHVIKLARSKILPHRMVGNRHKFLLSDVLIHQEKQAAEREEALRALAPESGYSAEDF